MIPHNDKKKEIFLMDLIFAGQGQQLAGLLSIPD